MTIVLPRVALLAVCLSVLVACGKDSPESLIKSAQDYSAKGEHSAAVIQLKNALQQAPDNAQARLLLGRALLETGDPAGAEKELRRALERGQPAEAVLPLLARALFLTRAYDNLVSEFGQQKLNDAAAEAAFKTQLAEAHLARGASDAAAAALQQAQTAQADLRSDYLPARLTQARLAAVEGRVDDAIKLIDALAGTGQPNALTAEALAVKGDLLLTRGEREPALQAYEQAVAADAKFMPARFALVSYLIEQKDYERASTQIDSLRKLARGDVRVVYLDGLLAFRKGDLNKARDLTLQVLKVAPEHVPTLALAGAVELQLNQAGAAEAHLRKAISRAPEHTGARRLLMAALLQQKQPARALEAAQPVLAAGVPQDQGLLMLTAETLLANGDLKQAAALYQAAAAGAQAATAKTRLGQIAFARGDAESGIREFEAATAIDPNLAQADLALIAGHVQRGDLAKALAAGNAFVKKQPTNPVAYQVLGGVQQAQRDVKAARSSFENALAQSPTYLPAVLALVNLDLAAKQPDAARKRLEAATEKDPKNEQAFLALAELRARTGGQPKDVLDALQKAVNANGQSAAARVALINFHLWQRDPKTAVNVAQQGLAALPNDPTVLDALGVAQQASGEFNQAIDSFNRVATLRPSAVEPLLRLAGLHVNRKDYGAAADALKRARKLAPNNRQIDLQLVAALTSQGKLDAALAEAQSLQKRQPKFAGGYLLEGDVYASQKKWPEAERAYREALRLEPNATAAALQLYTALHEAGKAKDAEALGARWIEQKPRDTAMRMAVADHALSNKNLKPAAAQYQAVLAAEPNNVLALNNLAWVAGQLGDPKAIDYAERAVKLAPQSAPVLDTLGILLVNRADEKRGDVQRGVELLQQAAALAPGRHDLRLNLAKGFIKAGQKDAARNELAALEAVKDNFPGKARLIEQVAELKKLL